MTMQDELWNEKLTRENLKDFYMSTVDMVYSSVFGITKEPTRCERAIVKSYLDIYAKRANVPAERVIYDFGDLLLENAKAIVADYPLPNGLSFEERKLDEYTRNSMIEKILAKIDSKSYKMAEFISTDVKKTKRTKQLNKVSSFFQVTPLLVLEVLILAGIVWFVAYVSVTFPYRNSPLIKERSIYEKSSIQQQYIAAIPFYPIKLRLPVTPGQAQQNAPDITATETTPPAETTTETALAPVINQTTEPVISATSG